jgi:hypothetical protein
VSIPRARSSSPLLVSIPGARSSSRDGYLTNSARLAVVTRSVFSSSFAFLAERRPAPLPAKHSSRGKPRPAAPRGIETAGLPRNALGTPTQKYASLGIGARKRAWGIYGRIYRRITLISRARVPRWPFLRLSTPAPYHSPNASGSSKNRR